PMNSLTAFFRKPGRAAWIMFLVVPPMVFMATFVVWPILSALAYAFYHWEGLKRGEFVGLGNFIDVLTREPFAAWTLNAFLHNVWVFIALMIVQNGFGFLIAYAISKELPGHRFHRVAVFLPVILSTVIVGFLWKLFLHPLFGLVNAAFVSVGLDSWAQPWLGQESTALWALVFVNAWHWVGFPALVFLAGMQRIPSEVIDAARLDGASEWTMITKIVWPLVAPSATICFVLLFIGSFNWFELPYVMTGLDGSPYGKTDVLGLLFYRTAFGNQSAGVQDFGRGSALAVLTFLFIAVVSAFWTIRLRKREIEI
ncbi:carbohydrate ABC transporter permease, partial [Lacibacterium aquatile]